MPLLNSIIKKMFGTRKKTNKTYTLNSSSPTFNEGDAIAFTTTTRNVASGTTLYYTVTGVATADISGGALSGSFNVSNNTGTVNITATNDNTTEGNETLTFQLRGDSTSGPILATSAVTLVDTSKNPLNADLLLIGGGGPGGRAMNGNHNAGGGGAGGFVEIFTMPLQVNSTYTATLGAGGTTAPGGYGVYGSNGANSTFIGSGISYTAAGGGWGRGTDGTAGSCNSGGSGGGPGCGSIQFSTYGYGYGNSGGGACGHRGNANPGGGGGAGGAGSASNECGGNGNGGAGRANPFSQSTVGVLSSGIYYLAGGGGGHNGGLGGVGGGGRATPEGNSSIPPVAGTANTGGGGGAGAATSVNAGAQGGSGVCVVRYLGSPKATGGTITQVGGYTLHTFTSSGTLTVTSGS